MARSGWEHDPSLRRYRGGLLAGSALSGTAAAALGAGLSGIAPGAAEAAVDNIQLGLGGFLNEYLFATSVDEDSADTRDFNAAATHFDGEVQFSGKVTLDNGLTFGAQVELEFPTVGDQIDEAFMIVEGSFGRLVLGGDNSASYTMGFGLWDPFVGVPINSGWVSDFAPPPPGMTIAFRSPAVSTAIDIQNDDNTFKYFSPRVAGFQFGVSYTPNASFGGNPTNGAVDLNGFTYDNGWSVAANYIGNFGDVEVGVSGGYAMAFAGDAVEAAGGDDIQQLMTGGYVKFGSFKLAGSYANELEGRISDGGAVSTEGQSYVVGLSYTTAPWTLGVAYFHGEVEGQTAISGDDEQDVLSFGVAYKVGPGIDVALNALYANYDTDEGQDSDAFAVSAGFGLAF